MVHAVNNETVLTNNTSHRVIEYFQYKIRAGKKINTWACTHTRMQFLLYGTFVFVRMLFTLLLFFSPVCYDAYISH